MPPNLDDSNSIKKIAYVFKEQSACVSDIQSGLIQIESTSPLCFRVLKPFVLRGANRSNWMQFPFNRFGLRNIESLHEIDRFKCNAADSLHFPTNPKLVENVEYWSHDGTRKTFLEMLIKTHTDGIVILQKGQLIYLAHITNDRNEMTD